MAASSLNIFIRRFLFERGLEFQFMYHSLISFPIYWMHCLFLLSTVCNKVLIFFSLTFVTIDLLLKLVGPKVCALKEDILQNFFLFDICMEVALCVHAAVLHLPPAYEVWTPALLMCHLSISPYYNA